MSETDLDPNVDDLTPEEIAKARQNGWSPKDKWRGDPDEWVDAREFNERSKTVLPFLRRTNERLEAESAQAKAEIARLAKLVETQQVAMKDLTSHQAEMIAQGVEDKIRDLKAEKREARREGDHDRVEELDEELDEQQGKLAKLKEKKPETTPTPSGPPAMEPWAAAFHEENKEWLGTNKRRTNVFLAMCDEFGGQYKGSALLEKAKQEMESLLDGESFRANKAEGGGAGGSRSASGSSSSNKDFAALPPEAKDMCNRQISRYVGEGKPFKTEKEWKAHYASTYFASMKRN